MSKTKKRAIAIVLAAVLLIGAVVGGTIAWLTDTTKIVTNTFTIGDINIDLKETSAVDDSGNLKQEYSSFVPGDKLLKDPTITVDANSEACYLFVKVTDTNNTYNTSDKYIKWTVRTGSGEWTPVDGHDGYWYREVEEKDTDQTFYVLTGEGTNANGQVEVNGDITKAEAEAIRTSNKPQIIVKAAAVQKDNIDTVEAAFAKLSGF